MILDGLAVKGLLADSTAAGHLFGDGAGGRLSLAEALALLQQGAPADREAYEDIFIDRLEEWEDELYRLDAEMEALTGERQAELAATFDSFSDLRAEVEAVLDSELADWAGVALLVEALRVKWETASHLVNALILRHAQDSAGEVTYAHLDSLALAASRFQSGTIGCAELQREVSEHTGRWASVVEVLRAEWAHESGNLCLLQTVEQSLRALTTIVSPGDARLGPVTQLYTSSLRSLMKAVSDRP